MEEYQEIIDFLQLQSDKVKRNCKIVSSEEVGQDFMLHIDRQTPKVFIPQMPRRAANNEDNTTPRITVSDSLLGCMIGYSSISHDFLEKGVNGLYINKLDFNYALKVNNKLVYDSDVSNEHWLVTYNEETRKYKPITIGKMFINNISYTRNEKRKYPIIELVEILVEIEEDITIRFNNTDNLSKGYYCINVNLSHLDQEDLNIRVIDRVEFMKAKSTSASMLSHESSIAPLFTKWL